MNTTLFPSNKIILSTLLKTIIIPLFFYSACVQGEDYTELSFEELGRLNVFTTPVLQAQTHQKGETMIAYYYHDMRMAKNGNGTHRLSTEDVLSDFMASPIKMNTNKHTLHLMYAPSDKLTLVTLFHYLENETDLRARNGLEFSTRSSGIGDTTVGMQYNFHESASKNGLSQWILRTCLSLPTGSIDEKDFLPLMQQETLLPYPMQLGSGSYQLESGIAFSRYWNRHHWGVLLNAKGALNANSENYRTGESANLKSWIAYSLNENLSLSLGGHYRWKNAYSGTDERLNSTIMPSADPQTQGRQVLDFQSGLDWLFFNKDGKRHILQLQMDKPVWQNLHGPQLQKKSNGSVRWIYAY